MSTPSVNMNQINYISVSMIDINTVLNAFISNITIEIPNMNKLKHLNIFRKLLPNPYIHSSSIYRCIKAKDPLFCPGRQEPN